MNVFYELPKDIQAELAKELNLQEKILQDLSSKNKSISVNSKGGNFYKYCLVAVKSQK